MSFDWLSPEEAGRAVGYLEEGFGIPAGAFSGHRLFRRGEYLHAVHEDAAGACEELACVAAGLKLLKVTGSGGFKPATRGIQVFGRWATRRVCDLAEEDLGHLLEGRSLPWPGERGPVIVRCQGLPVGMGVIREGQLVGQFPRSVTEHLRL